MRLKGPSLWAMLAIIALVGALVPLAASRAQGNGVTITLAVPSFTADIYNDQLLGAFTSAHPGVNVIIVKYDISVPRATGGTDAYLQALQPYVASADVLSVDPQRSTISEAATRAGYYLNLAPLVGADASLKTDDFFPAVWQSFQWDKGIWALPISTDALVMSYDPTAFDNAKLAYPTEKWTIDDFVNAANKLGVKDPNPQLSKPGLVVAGNNNVTALLRSLLSQGLFDTNTLPNAPRIDSAETEALLDTWQQQLVSTGLLSTSGSDQANAGLTVTTLSNFTRVRPGDPVRVGVLLPGGKAGLTPQGFAVSAGSQHPAEAYAFASFLTTRAEVTGRGSISPARKSLVGAQTSGGGGGGPRGGGPRTISPEVQALITKALDNGIPFSEMRYADYLSVALQQMRTKKLTAQVALQNVEAQASTDLQAADTAKTNATTALVVATPVPTAVLTGNKIALKFNLASFVSPLPNQDRWNKLIADFISTDPQVGRITLDTSPRLGALDQAVQNYDCFYLPYNVVPTTNLGLLLNLDSFMAADASFDKSDVVGNVLDQLKRDNKTWGFPIMIQPGILQYDSAQFAKAGIPDPNSGWTIDAFNNAVKTLKVDSSTPPPFIARNTGGTHLLILAAAYGGLPLDYRTTPTTINFTDATNVNAIRQALDLAKNGYLQYNALANFNFGGGPGNLQTAIYTSNLNAFLLQNTAAANTQANNYKPIAYPKGSKYAGVSYSIGTAYVSANSQNPEACYRWISTIAKHPDLFSAMPARRSLINDPALAAVQGPANTNLYNQIDTLLKNPDTLSFPSLQGGGGNGISNFLVQHWLFAAFDKYVLDNGDLEAALKDAETTAKGFQSCVAALPAFDPSTQTTQDYNRLYANCAVQVDASLKSLIGG